MPRYIAFLRAINAGPRRVVTMDILRRVFASLGFTHIETFLGTGNVVFDSRVRNTQTLEQKISVTLRAELGYNADAFIRTLAELLVIARYQPFTAAELADDTQLNIVFLLAAPGAQFATALKQMQTDYHRVRLHGRELYWLRRKHPQTGNYTGLPLAQSISGPYTVRDTSSVAQIAAKYAFTDRGVTMPAKQPANTIPPDKLSLYEKLVATIPGVERKGDTMPYTSHNGHMFSYLSKDGTLVLRLPTEAREAFLKKYKTTLHEAYGLIQKEYVDVPEALLKRTADLAPYFAQSHAYVESLKPKPTRKPKKE